MQLFLLIKFSSLKELRNWKKKIFHFFSKYGNTVFSSTGQTVREKKAHLVFFYIIIIKDWIYIKCLNESSKCSGPGLMRLGTTWSRGRELTPIISKVPSNPNLPVMLWMATCNCQSLPWFSEGKNTQLCNLTLKFLIKILSMLIFPTEYWTSHMNVSRYPPSCTYCNSLSYT